MTRIAAVELLHVDLPPPVPRSDAIQSFVTQETPFVRIICDDGSEGIGYSYTIGTGGSSVMALLRDHLAPRLIGRDPAHDRGDLARPDVRHPCHHAWARSPAWRWPPIDTALWDWRCRRDGQPLWLAAGGAKTRIPVYTTEGGWLHLSPDDLVRETVAAQEAGFKGAKVKVGKPHVSEDVARLTAVREAVGDGFEIMVDANQCFTLERSAAPRAALCRARHRLVRGAAAGRRHHRPRAAGGGQRGADRGGRIAVLAWPVRGLHAAGRGVDRAGGRGARRRHHALAEGGAPGRGLQPGRLPAFPDGTARLAVRARCRARRGWNTSRSSTPLPTAGW